MKLSPEQRTRFDEQGFLNVGRLFSGVELDEIRAEYDALVRPDAQVLGNADDGFFPYRAMLNFRSPALARYVLHAGMVELAADLLGPDVRFWWDQGINKSPGAGSPIPWHQDNGYEKGRMQAYLTCWLALDDSSLENGGLLVLPGSHREGQRDHVFEGAHAVIPEVDDAGAIALDAAAGELLVFSSLLVHETVGNQTPDRDRRAWVVQYCRGDQRNDVTGEIYDNRPWVVRGGARQDALEAERPFDLRGDRP